tara:strand:+ start:978 stop:1571 length:594 start_codon:yes stop_codon:yes gene_type:complete
MAFKMNRPLKMKGPMKSVLKLGRKNKSADDLYYNSKMGPMQMHSPSALKQMEEGAPDMGGMEAMMGMMGGGEAPAAPQPPGAKEEKTGGKVESSWQFDAMDLEGGAMGKVEKDEATGMLYVIVENEDELIKGIGKDAKVFLPPNIVKDAGAKVGELLPDNDYQVQLNPETNEYEVQVVNPSGTGQEDFEPEFEGGDE